LLGLVAMRYGAVLHHRAGCAEAVSGGRGGPSRHVALPAWLGSLSARGACDAIGAIATAERQLDLNANAQLCVEALLIRLGRLAGT